MKTLIITGIIVWGIVILEVLIISILELYIFIPKLVIFFLLVKYIL